jgi:hypothetical protein
MSDAARELLHDVLALPGEERLEPASEVIASFDEARPAGAEPAREAEIAAFLGTGISRRIASVVGLVTTAAGVALGWIWPSLFTLVTVALLPAPFVFGLAVVRPTVIESPGVRDYLVGATVVALALVMCDAIWITE